MAGPRTIHVTGGTSNRGGSGQTCEVTLQAGEGLRELKTAIRQAFGKYDYHKLSKLTLQNGGAEVKKNHLVNGTTVVCHYVTAYGDTSGLSRGRRGGFGGFGGFRGGFGGRLSSRDRAMLMMLGGF